MKQLFLTFSGITVLLDFEDEGFERPLKKALVDAITVHYKNLLVSSSKTIDYTIHFKESNIINQIKFKNKTNYAEFYTKDNTNTYQTFFHISMVQFQLLLQIILHESVLKSSKIMLHASGNVINNKTVVFLGKSGSGKTTISSMLSSKYPSIAEDTIIIDFLRNKYYTYQTPFVEKTFIPKVAKATPLGGIYFLTKSKDYKIGKMNDKNMIFRLLLENCIIENKKNISMYIRKAHNLAHTFDHFYTIEFGLDTNNLLKLLH